jgi:hypothetical protein
MSDLVARQFQRARDDQAAPRFLPLGNGLLGNPGGVNLRPDLVFTAKGPNSSIEKKASSLPRLPKIE